MALPTSYLTSTRRLSEILDALKTAKAPEKFTQRFLESLEFKAKGDRLIIGVLKGLGLLDDTGQPTDRYFQFIDQSKSAVVLATAIEEAYGDLFTVNRNAHTLSKQEVQGKLKTLTQGQFSDSVLDKMSTTFTALVSLADFDSTRNAPTISSKQGNEQQKKTENSQVLEKKQTPNGLNLGGLVYNIQIVLPETRDPKVYDVLFRSLKEHLL